MRSLDLSHNVLTSVAPLAVLLCLEHLDVADNRLTSLTDVRALGAAGEARALPEGDYASVIGPDGEARVLLRRAVPERRVLVRYAAGLAADWASLDPAIRQGVIRLAAHYFLERGSDQAATPPASVAALWRPHRRLRLR